jgi:hypothetical protein
VINSARRAARQGATVESLMVHIDRAVARRLGLVGLPQTAAVEDVVLEVRPTSGASRTAWMAVAPQIRRVADTAERQDLRGVDAARAQDDLTRGHAPMTRVVACGVPERCTPR